jgi:hypothetical protein
MLHKPLSQAIVFLADEGIPGVLKVDGVFLRISFDIISLASVGLSLFLAGDEVPIPRVEVFWVIS